MQLFKLLLLVLIVLLLLINISFFLPGKENATAIVHPMFHSLLKSSEYSSSHSGFFDSGYAAGILMLAAIALCVLIGIRKNGKLASLGQWLVGGFVVYTLIFVALMYSYHLFARGNIDTFFGGFPLSTSLLVYGIWLFPLFFIIWKCVCSFPVLCWFFIP